MSIDPKIYHIVHVDRLPSIIANGWIWSDATMAGRTETGTNIGMDNIKQRRLTMPLDSYPDLHVGDCVPFYFCPRSVMLYMLHQSNHPDLSYRGGQGPIIHLEADLHQTVSWAEKQSLRWAFTLSNAGSTYFEDRCKLTQLKEIKWDAVQAHNWKNCKEGKQAEFLLERQFPWKLIQQIGVHSGPIQSKVRAAMAQDDHQPKVGVASKWYY